LGQDSHAFFSHFSEGSLIPPSDFSFFSIFFLSWTAELEDFQNKFLQLKKVRFFEKSRKMAKTQKHLTKSLSTAVFLIMDY
jgi:predicted NACHT family NTPase